VGATIGASSATTAATVGATIGAAASAAVVGAPVVGVAAGATAGAEDAEDTVVAAGVTFIGANVVPTFIGANVIHGLDDEDDAMDFALGSFVCIKIFYFVWSFYLILFYFL